ncbi:fimbrial protein [Escherichia coli]|uniref:fimbrial protein n=1 Tax=Escherichia coli TaxID=562 RepID=UPI001B342821|nr:fimbrial protein [Escherichia coli]EEZ9068109.1 type 1 fimbrial protein [Escherichia coli]MBP4021428.1 type 1 fimbrial protein [Escherichia coli]MCJ7910121.1 type 1 fimbrial protein [Escherichia coli]
MKKTIMSLAVVSALFSGAAMAAGADNDSSYATLNFSGRVTANMCQVSTSDVVKDIDLGEITKTQIKDGTQKKQSFSVQLNNCDTSVSQISYILSDGNNNKDQATYLQPTSGDTSAQGVGVYVETSDGTAIVTGQTNNIDVLKNADGALPQQTIALRAYVDAINVDKTTGVVGGTVNATGTLTIKATTASAA